MTSHLKAFLRMTFVALGLLVITVGARATVDYPIVIHRGNGLANVFARLNSGQSAKIAYIGGSVTQSTGWRDNVTAWFRSQYPGRITEVNAGWSGTGSLIGAMRYARDVLSQNPDLVFIEFAINDLPDDPINFIERNCEGMVRQTWAQSVMTDICFIETISYYIEQPYLNGYYPTTVQAHYNVCNYYGCSSVNVGWALYQRVLAGTPWTDLAPDRVHPNAAGSKIYSDAVISYLVSEKARAGTPAPHAIPGPKTDFPVMGGAIKDMVTVSPLPSGWSAHYNEYGVASFVQCGTAEATISISFNGPAAAAKVIVGPDASEGWGLSYSIDGGAYWPANQSVPGWAYIWAFPIAKTLSIGPHTVTFKVNSGVARIINVEAATTRDIGQNDAGSGTDAGNDFASALPITPGIYTGYVHITGDENDYYKFNAATGKTVSCSLTPPSGTDFDLYIYNPSGTLKASSTNRGSVKDAVVLQTDESGDWRMRIRAYSGGGTYEFSLSVEDMNSSEPTGTNLARSASWQTDSNYSANFNGSKAIDGICSASSKWTSLGTSPPHWLALDLGGNYLINGFIVRHAGAGGEETYYNTKAFKIQSGASMSGPWIDETSVDNSSQANITYRSYNVPKILRYVRLYITNPGIDNYARIPEFEVLGAVDSTPPTTPEVTDDGRYTITTAELHASWTASDPETGVAEYQYAIGTSVGGTDVVGWTSAGTATSVTKTGLNLGYDKTYYFGVKARNGVGLWSQAGWSNGITTARPVSSVAEAKAKPDSSAVHLSAKLVSANIGSCFWIEEDDRSAGLRINTSSAVPTGSRVTLTGKLATYQGDRYLDEVVGSLAGAGSAPRPIGICSKFLGGNDLNAYTPGVKDGIGPNNVGLLVQIWGRVTELSSDYFYIDDDTSLDGIGVRVLTSPGSLTQGDYVIVTGLSTTYRSLGQYFRAVKPTAGGIRKI